MEGGGGRRYEGKVCVVTGAAAGIGAAIARGFGREGGRVALLDVNEEGARETAAACGPQAQAYRCDVSDPEQVRAAFASVASDLGAVDVLVNNAGIAIRRQDVQDRMLANLEAAMSGGERQSLRATSTLDDETLDRTLKVHLYGTIYCCREALRVMEERGAGVILNLSSVYGVWGGEPTPEYSAAKGGIAALTKGMAKEVAPGGIRVNAIAPGYVETAMTAEGFDPRIREAFLSTVPMGVPTQPETIAHLALHLCSDEASYTTGQIVSPNGGLFT
jgi:3-oxoacyl-[acyl-carrier protein] reductase